MYAAADVLAAGAFDLVYTGVGALCWLPDIRRWAGVVAALLRPGGRLFIRDGHPMLWTIEERDDDVLAVKYPYFEQPEPFTWTEGGTYVDTDMVFSRTSATSGTTASARSSPPCSTPASRSPAWPSTTACRGTPSRARWSRSPGDEWRLADRPARLPCSFTIQAVKPLR